MSQAKSPRVSEILFEKSPIFQIKREQRLGLESERSEIEKPNLGDLPQEILQHILSFIPGRSMLMLSQVSTAISRLLYATLPETVDSEIYIRLVFNQGNYLAFIRYPQYFSRLHCPMAVKFDLTDVFIRTYTVQLYERCLQYTLEFDRVEIYKYIYSTEALIAFKTMLYNAVAKKAWKIARWIISIFPNKTSINYAFETSCTLEDLDAINFLIDRVDGTIIHSHMFIAIINNKLTVVKCLLNWRKFNVKWMIATATEWNSVDVLQYLRSIYDINIDGLLECDRWKYKSWTLYYFSDSVKCKCGHTMYDHIGYV